MAIADVSNRSLGELTSLAGRTAVVTGGAQGLGYAIARRLAEAGASVLIGDVNADCGHRAAESLNARSSGQIIATHLDVADEQSTFAAAELAETRLGGIHIWVNNAGLYPSIRLVDTNVEDWEKVMAVNLRGVFLGVREAARRMVAAGSGGVVVNISSSAGFRAEAPGLAAYGTSKHGVRGLTRQVALELAPHGIRVLGVAPSFCKTEGNMAAVAATPGLAEEISSIVTSPLGRIGEADDIARVAFFCVSDLSLFMSGTTLLVDGANLA